MQKIIDFQWVSSGKMMNFEFIMYVVLYLLPVCITLFTEDEDVHTRCLQTACIPAFVLFYIEIVQLR